MRRRSLLPLVLALPLALAIGSAAAGSPPGDQQANQPQVAGDAGSNATAVFPTNKQNEPTIAVNPQNPSILLAGANDEQEQPPCGPGPVRGNVPASDCSFFPWVGTSGLYRSTDGGDTWTNLGMIDDYWSPTTHTTGTRVVSDGDPVLVWGPKPDGHGGFTYARGARAYYAMLGGVEAQKGFEFVIVTYSDDNGSHWADPVIATTKTSAVDFNDKNWIGVDDNPGSPYFGRVYVSWTEFRSATARGYGNEPTMIAYSTDGGATFGKPNQLSPAGNNGTGNGRQGTSIAVGADGSVYVAFEQGPAQVLAVSRDGGRSFGRPLTIAGVSDIDDPIPGTSFRTNSFPTIATDPSSAAVVYTAWSSKIDGQGRIVVSTSRDGGRTWSAPATVSTAAEGYAFYQGLDVAPNGRVDLAYQAVKVTNPSSPAAAGNAAINSYAVSKPLNLGWTSPVTVSTASSDPAASSANALTDQFIGDYNTLVSTNARTWFVWTDTRNGRPCPAVDAYQQYLRTSHIAGRDDDEDLQSFRNDGLDLALTDPSVKPSPGLSCPSQFGNSDIYVARWDH